jgi:hypothetical protein
VKTVACWDALREFGIDALTGEACGLGYRLLCDVTRKGKQVLEKCFGIPNLTLPSSWNPGTKEDPHVGSIMLAFRMLTPVAVFALLEGGCTEVFLSGDGTVYGMEPSDDRERCLKNLEVTHKEGLRRSAYRGTAGDRNVHVMSGRVV